ncbi:hypothetical protein HPB47_027598 [Ixodes persulcatus]|uniref:Uncharacterized protein n=1 Tax=Ixodes persulcatus TaxID=34615 RepID=A0AC60PVF8_IXOPE|nr:hypothetical protein HPB47_027598 [Ixodes persulcatus]
MDGSPTTTSHERETRVFRRRDASARARGSNGRRSRADPTSTSTTEEGKLEWEVVTGESEDEYHQRRQQAPRGRQPPAWTPVSRSTLTTTTKARTSPKRRPVFRSR